VRPALSGALPKATLETVFGAGFAEGRFRSGALGDEGAPGKIEVQIRLSAFTLPQGGIEKFERD
jgi:hypothetical protein